MPPKRKTKKELAAAAAAAAVVAAEEVKVEETGVLEGGVLEGGVLEGGVLEGGACLVSIPVASLTGSGSVAAAVAATEEIENTITTPIVMQLSIPSKRVEQLIKDDESKMPLYNDPTPYIKDNTFISENDKLEITTDKLHTHHEIICYWCCHNIINTEYGMPVRYDVFHNNFTLFGSFCSLECASAYNFSINMGCDRAWEIHSWIQLLAKNYGLETPIRPSPNRYLLDMFNGPMTIEDFRNSHKGFLKTYVMNIPPFIHITSQIEILNTSFLEKNKEMPKTTSKIGKISKLMPEQKMIST